MAETITRPNSGWKGNRGSRHERGYDSKWVKLRAVILQRDAHLCQPCLAQGRPIPATAVDHIKAKANGGTDDAENLRAICDECHKAKTAQDAGGKPRTQYDAQGYPVWV